MQNYTVTIKRGINKDTNKEWTGLLVTIGEWSQLIFPKSKFEMDYIIKQLQNENTEVKVNQKQPC